MSTLITSGMKLTPARLNEVTRYRTADQSVTNSTTLTNDNTLFFTPGINTVWAVEFLLLYSATTTEDGKVSLTFPSGATCPWGIVAYDASLAFSAIAFAAPTSGSSNFALGGNGAANALVCQLSATLSMGSTAGDLRLQFAQLAAAAGTSMTMRTGSRLLAYRLA